MTTEPQDLGGSYRMPTEDEQLNQALAQDSSGGRTQRDYSANQPSSSGQYPAASSVANFLVEFRQWQVGPNDTYRAAGLTRERLPPAIYSFREDQLGIYMQRENIVTDSLYELPDTANERVLAGMKTFWERADLYRKHGLLYKRGVLLWGPPGSGKTTTLSLLSRQLIAQDGVVVLCMRPYICSLGLAMLRRIEPTRRLICIIEDIDEVINMYTEHELLSLLDGENQVDNIVIVATTNFPERLGARIVNRPARFDERVLVGMPSAQARRVYLSRTAHGITAGDLDRWVMDSDGLSIAHLRELTAAVLCLGQDYDSVLARLKSMRHRIKEKDGGGEGFAEGKVGFV